MAPVDDDIGFMGPILGRAKKVLFPDDYPVEEQRDAQKSANTAVVNKKKKTKSRARRAGRLESAGGSSLANVTIGDNSGNDGKENNRSQSSLNVSQNKKRGSAHRKMDSLAVASTIQMDEVKRNESKEKNQQPLPRRKPSAGGRRSDGNRSILEAQESSLLVSSAEPQQQKKGNIKSTSGRRSNGIKTCSLLMSSEPEQQQNRERRKSRVRFQSESALLLDKNDEKKHNNANQQQQNRRRGRSNHPMSSLVQSESGADVTIKSNSKRGSSTGGISSRSSAGASSLMALPSSTQKKSRSPQRQQKKKIAPSSKRRSFVGRLSLDNEQQLPLSPTFRSPLIMRQRSSRLSGEIASPEGILRFSTISNISNVFQQQHISMECSPLPCLNPRKRVDKKKTPPKIIGLTSSQSPSELPALPDQNRKSPRELVESPPLPEPATSTEMDIDSKPTADAVQAAIVTEAESYIGRRIARTFDKQVYHGTVAGFIKTHRLWKISYDDGDKEEMDFEELSYAMDLYDGKIKEAELADTGQDEEEDRHKPGSAVIEIETAPPIEKPSKPKKTYSKLPKKQLQTTKGSEEEVSNEIVTIPTKDGAEPTRRSTRAAKPTDRLTVASWKRKTNSNKNVDHTAEEADDTSPDSPPASNNVINKEDNEPEHSQSPVVEIDPIKQDGVWSNDEVAALRGAIKEMNPTSATYWEDVSSAVGTKAPYDCRQKWFSLVATPRVKRATSKKESKSHLNAIDSKLTGNDSSAVGRDDDDDDDDLFDATPFRGESVENQDDIEQRIEKSEQIEVSNVKNRRKGYNTYIENLRKDLNRKGQKTKPNKPIQMNKKLASDSRVFVNESDTNGVSGQLLPDGTVQINEQENSIDEEEMDDMWADSSDEE
ncbi:hypothetical protein QTG54_003287 [Skeletonema marinoi]|uniref:Myb-like domain-containing protein n=1 Tax=Skeletonema marinoi TaxID=267567 RepID=A0AAD8YJT6_9STRA|nr:hypothetical protein QTG54_003287 [Skeletonema marinoi]